MSLIAEEVESHTCRSLEVKKKFAKIKQAGPHPRNNKIIFLIFLFIGVVSVAGYIIVSLGDMIMHPQQPPYAVPPTASVPSTSTTAPTVAPTK